MGRVLISSDWHLGHDNILKFKRDDGTPLRDFKTIEEHDETIISRHNEVVKPEDTLYFLGDAVMNRRHLRQISRMNGRKVLIKGNHDIFPLEDYTPWFDDIRAYKVFPQHGLILSHIPLHPCQFEGRWKYNGHGHLHANLVNVTKHHPDLRYMNLCMEHIDYRPLTLEEVLARFEAGTR